MSSYSFSVSDGKQTGKKADEDDDERKLILAWVGKRFRSRISISCAEKREKRAA